MALTNRRRFPVLLILIAALALFLAGTPAWAQEGSAPDAPTGLIVASVSHDSVELDWDDSGDSSITHYQVFRRDRAVHDAGEFVIIEEDTGTTATEYTDATVEADKEYVYRVKAVNAHGASPWSDHVRADTPTAPLRAEISDEPESQGAVYTYEDGDRTIRVILQGDLVLQETGADTPSDDVARRAAGGNIVRRQFVRGGADLPVFRSASGGALMTLPGGVLLALDREWDEAMVNGFFARNNIWKGRISELDYIPNGFFVRTEPGFPSLELANALAAQKGVVVSSPNWWREVGTRQDPEETKGDDREGTQEAQGIQPRNEGIGEAYDLPLDGSYTEPTYIYPADDIDYFKLDLLGQAGDTDVRIYTTGEFDTIGELYDSELNFLTIDVDSFGTDNFSLLASLSPDIYYVLVRGSGFDTGSYTLHSETVTATSSVSLGSSVAASIGAAGEVDYFKLDLSGQIGNTDVSLFTLSDNLALEMEATPFESWLRRWNQDALGDVRWITYLGYGSLSPGSYLFAVWSPSGDTGDYSLRAATLPDHGSTTAAATDLSLDAPTSGKLTSASDADYFKLVLTEAKDLAIMALAYDGVDVVMLNSGGTEIPVNEEIAPRDHKIIDGFAPGTYYVKITAPDASSSAPVYYALYAYEDTGYGTWVEGCTDDTNDLGISTINDPLYACQWHLNSADSSDMDINVESVWDDGITGEGINVVVVDYTIDHSHDDLSANINSALNHDYGARSNAYRPADHHGTNVAGVIAARDNTIGVRGVAPRATIYGHNLLADGEIYVTDVNKADAMARNRVATAVSNNSWGPVDGFGFDHAPAVWEMAIDSGVTQGYQGKGVFYAWAGGNGHERGDDSNFDEYATYYGVTAVCAVGDDGARATYSEQGANLWVCAPSSGGDRGIVTTENSDRYINDFSGTSSATPKVSGVAALLRHANPDLTWRDLKLILAASARQNDASNAGWEQGARKYGSTDDADRYHFNHEYGFGVVDAAAAVALAQDWRNLPEFKNASSASGTLNLTIPDNTASGITSSLTLDTDIDFTEFVEVNVTIDHSFWRDLRIELVSPAGVVSKLAVPLDPDLPTRVFVPDSTFSPGTFRFGSARHLGEDPNGTWTLRVADELASDEGTLTSWSIKVYGHDNPVRAVSTGRTTATATVELHNPDSESLTVHLRYSDDDGTTWANPAMQTTTGTSVDFNLTGLAPNAKYVLEASLDSTFGERSDFIANFVNRPANRDIDTLAAAGNTAPIGLWSDGTTIWVADSEDDKLYAYTLATGARDEGKDIGTLAAAGNTVPVGLWSDGTTIWVVNNGSGTGNKLYAYTLATGARDEDKDFDTLYAAGNINPFGLWSDSTTIWVAHFGATNSDAKIYAYTLATGALDEDKDFDTLAVAGNDDPRGLWSDGTTIWVADSEDDKLYAYTLATGALDEDKDIGTLAAAGNTVPYGLWSDDTTIWVADSEDDKLYAYYIEVSTSTPVNPAPTRFAASNGNGQVTLTWDAPAADADIARHEYRFKTTGDYPAAWTAIDDSAPGGLHEDWVVVAGLTNNVAYTFQLRTVNAAGAAGAAVEDNPATPRSGVCGRTAQVRDAILFEITGVSDCADVTPEQLAGVRRLVLENRRSKSLQRGDFSGLTALRWLHLDNNDLSSLPHNVFSDLTALVGLELDRNELSSLPNGVFSDLTALERLWLDENELSSLPDGVFSSLTALWQIWLGENELSSLPDGVFSDQSNLSALDLHNNKLSSLPDGVFSGLTVLANLFLQGNAEDPLPLAVTLEKNPDAAEIRAVVLTAAPFAVPLTVSVENGSLEGGATTITVPAGARESAWVSVTRTAGTTGAVTADIDLTTQPSLVVQHDGYAFVKSSDDLPLTVSAGAAPAPDLVVDTPTASPSSPAAGASFTLSATVRNQGGSEAAASTLRYYRSSNATIDTNDSSVGTDTVSGLAAAGTSAESIDLTAPSTAGTYYYGACVDAVTNESATGNNCSTGVRVTVVGPPDLVVDTPTASPSSPLTGASFTLRATVRNQGGAAAGSSTLRYYRSTNATIDTNDTAAGTDSVPSLSAGASSAQSIRLTAPATTGTYYYGACVSTVSGESATTNNCSAAVTVTVTAPDLVVESPSVSDGRPLTGAPFTLSATVRNQGGAAAGSTTLRYYRSTNDTISTSDTAVGTKTVSGLAAAGTSAESIDLTAPTSAGTYYYGACVDAVTNESDRTNNCSTAVRVTVIGRPDLVMVTPAVIPSNPLTGASFTFWTTVRNRGSGEAGSTTLRYYRSTDDTIDTNDTAVGTNPVYSLSAGLVSPESIRLFAPDAEGTYYYYACVDAVSGESDTANNCSATVTVTVTAPDLVVDPPTVSDSSPLAGSFFTLSTTVRNQGSAATVVAPDLRYYRSTDDTIDTSDTLEGFYPVIGLGAGFWSPESIRLFAPDAPGTYYYGACVSTVANESDTTNNCSTGVRVTVVGPPDLVVESPSVSDSSPLTGASFTLRATVRNQGGAAAGSSTLRYYRSTNATIDTNDTAAGTDSVPSLSAGASSAQSIRLTAPATTGTYYYGACVSTVSGESATTNNCSAAVTVTVTAPDLVVESPSVSDGRPLTGAPFTLSATVRNQGSGAAGSTTLRYYRSTNDTIDTNDSSVGTDPVSGLAAAATSAESIDLTTPSTAGTYYYGACVGTVTNESDTTNNCSAAVTVTVVTPPDLVVGTPTVSDSNPAAGTALTLSATVRNQGGSTAAGTTLTYYRSTNATIDTNDTSVGTDPVSGLAAGASSPESTSVTAPSTTGTYYYGACVDAVTNESDTTNNCSVAVAVTVGAAPAPDLVVEEPTVSDSSPLTGASFTLRATVRNLGSGAAGSTTLRYYRSSDATITTSDTPETSTAAVGVLDAGASITQLIPLTAPSTTGTYYYGACVDALTNESDTTNNCSAAVRVTVGAAPVFSEGAGTDRSVAENTVSGMNVGAAVTATDADNDTLTYSLEGTDAASFSIVSTRGQIQTSAELNHEARPSYSVTVRADDGKGGTATIRVTIRVTDVNEPPTVDGEAQLTLSENEDLIASYSASDPEGVASTFIWSVAGTDRADFNIDRNTGELTFRNTPDYESPADSNRDNVYVFTVRATDEGGLSGSLEVTATVANVDEPPTITGSATPPDFPENGVRSVATYRATDPEGRTIAWDLSGTDSDDFNIDGGVLTFQSAPDYEKPTDSNQDNEYLVTVQATDEGGNPASLDVTVTVINSAGVEEPSITTSQPSLTLQENGTGTIFTFRARDPQGRPIRWSLTGDDASNFTISISGGALTFISPPDFEHPADANRDNVYELTVVVTDDQGLTDSFDFTVTVTNHHENREPAITTRPSSGLTYQKLNYQENRTSTVHTYRARNHGSGPIIWSLSGTDFDSFDISELGALTFKSAPNHEALGDSNRDNDYEIAVVASNSGDYSDRLNVVITVTDVNEGPEVTGGRSSFTISENQDLPSAVYTGFDPEGGTVTRWTVGGTDGGDFTISQEGVLTFRNTPDFERPADSNRDNIYQLQVRPYDGRYYGSFDVTVTVTDVNEPPAITTTSSSATALRQNENVTSRLYTYRATDPEGADTVTWSVEGVDKEFFAIDERGQFSFKEDSPPDYERPADSGRDNVYNVEIQAGDSGGIEASLPVTVTVRDVNEGPEVTGGRSSFTISENQDLPSAVYTGFDPEGDTVTRWTVGGTDGGDFTISQEGVLTFRNTPDFERPADSNRDNIYQLQVRPYDGRYYGSFDVTVTVTDVNEPPAITTTSSSATALRQNENVTSRLYTYRATDPEGADTVTWSVEGVDARFFDIDEKGQFSFKEDSPPDFEQPADSDRDNVYNVEIQAGDSGGIEASLPVTVTVANDAEGVEPTITTRRPPATYRENGTSAVYTFRATDPQRKTVTWTLQGTDKEEFTLAPDSSGRGVLAFISPPDYENPEDSDRGNDYELTVIATDEDGHIDRLSFTITVTEVDEGPEVSGPSSFSINENESLPDAVYTARDPEGSNVARWSVGGRDGGDFFITQGGTLYFRSPPDYERPADSDRDNMYEVTIQPSDGRNNGAYPVTVTVTNVNEAPIITTTSRIAFSQPENRTSTLSTFRATDPEGGTVKWLVAGTDDGRLFTIDERGQFSFREENPPDFDDPKDVDRDNLYKVTIQAQDPESKTASLPVTVTVTEVNEGPVISRQGSAPGSVPENHSVTRVLATYTARDPERPGVTITQWSTAGRDGGDFVINALGQLMFWNPPDYERPADSDRDNVYEVTIRASDGRNTGTLEEVQRVTVTDVNEAPIITTTSRTAFTQPEDRTSTLYTFRATDPEGGDVSWDLSGTDSSAFTMSETGALSFTNPPDFESPTDSGGDNVYNVTVQASDERNTGTLDVTVTVTDHNEGQEPTISTRRPPSTYRENDTRTVYTFRATDPQRDTIIWTLVGTDAGHFTITPDSSGQAVLAFRNSPNFESPVDADRDNEYELAVVATDDQGNSDRVDFAIAVTDHNEGVEPTISTRRPPATYRENDTRTVYTFRATDPQRGTTITWTLEGTDAADFTITPDSSGRGVLAFISPPDFESPADADTNNIYELAVVATDDEDNSDRVDFTIAVTDVNEGPVITLEGAATTSVRENTPDTQVLADYTATDPEDPTANIFRWSTAGRDGGDFVISDLGELRFRSSPDYERPADSDRNNVYEVTVRAYDGRVYGAHDVTVTVTQVNEAPVITTKSRTEFTLRENFTAVLYTYRATDQDEDDAVTWSVERADGGDFAIYNGILNFRLLPDLENPADEDEDNVYEITVVAADRAGLRDTVNAVITITDQSEGPVIAGTTSHTVAENYDIAQVLGSYTATDARDNRPVFPRWSLSGRDGGDFSINEDGELTFRNIPDYDRPADSNRDNVYEVTVRGHDSQAYGDLDVTVTVTPVNEHNPVVTGRETLSFRENTAVETRLHTYRATDGDRDTSFTWSLEGDDADDFLIDEGALTFSAPPDYERPADRDTDNVYQVTVVASDGANRGTLGVTVTVTEQNEGPVVSGAPEFTIDENQHLPSSAVYTARDPEAVGGVTTTIRWSVSGRDGGDFTMDRDTGVLTFRTPPDHERPADANRDNVYEVTVRAHDGRNYGDFEVTVTVEDVAEITGPAALSQTENFEGVLATYSPAGQGVLDPEPSWRLTGADSGDFTIDRESGQLTFRSIPDHERPADANRDNVYGFTVQVSDGSYHGTLDVTVTVTAVNEPPAITGRDSLSFRENTPVTTRLHTYRATDPEGDGFTWRLGGLDASDFTITTDSSGRGVLTFSSPPNFDSPGGSGAHGNQYLVTVQARDAQGETGEFPVTVTVTDQNEGAVVTGQQTIAVEENRDPTLTLATYSASDPEGQPIIRWNLSGSDGGDFLISENGELTFRNTPDYDRPADSDRDNEYRVTVRAYDGRTYGNLDVTITVSNVNEHGPVIRSGSRTSFTYREEGASALYTYRATDGDKDDVITWTTGGADGSLFEFDERNGLVFLEPPDYEEPQDSGANREYNLTVVATDSGGLTDRLDVTVTVTAVDEGPEVSGATTYTVSEGQDLAGATFTARDPEDAGAAVSSWRLAGSDAGDFTITDTGQNSAQLTFRNTPDYDRPADSNRDNEYLVTIRAYNGSTNGSLDVTVTVTDRNEAEPVVTGRDTLSFRENTATTTRLHTYRATDTDRDATITWSVKGTDGGDFTISTGGELFFSSIPDHEQAADSDSDNVYEITVVASDGSNEDTLAVTVTVTDVNEGPEITGTQSLSFAENTASDRVLATYAATDPEDPDLEITRWSVTGPDGGDFAINEEGDLTFRNPPDHERPADSGRDNVYEVTVRASDGRVYGAHDVTVTVEAVDEAPEFRRGSKDSFSYRENGTASLYTYRATDPEGAEVAWSVSGADGGDFTIDRNTGVLNFREPPDHDDPADDGRDNEYEVTVVATDQTGRAANLPVTVTVTDVNEGPEIAETGTNTAITVRENHDEVLATYTATDPEDQPVTRWSVTGRDGGDFTINEGGELTFRNLPDHERPADSNRDSIYEVTVRASDGRYYGTLDVVVTVEAVDEAPEFQRNTQDSFVYPENGASAIYTYRATDPEGSDVTWGLSGTDSSAISIGRTGVLTFNSPPDYEAPADRDDDNVYQVVVHATDDDSNTTPLDVTVTVTNLTDARAVIRGTAQVGRTLTAETSGIPDEDRRDKVDLSYQWLGDDKDIEGATDSTYEITEKDEGKAIKVRVTFTDNVGKEETLTSAATAPVKPAQSNEPATGLPTINGKAQVGETLTADTSGISDADGMTNAVFRYQWTRWDSDTDEDIEGATDSTYEVSDEDEGKTIRLRVSFSDDRGNDEALTSAATGAVAARPAPLTATFPASPFQSSRHKGDDDRPQVIVAFNLPVQSFDKTTRSVSLTGATVSSLVRHEEDGLENAWVFFLDPEGNDEIVFTLVAGQSCDGGGICTGEGKMLSEDGTTTLPGPDEEDKPDNTDSNEPDNPATGLPTINGTAQVGETLTANTSGVADADGLSSVQYEYQWLADDAEIVGATGSTYTLTDSEESKTVKVQVSFTDDAAHDETLTSAATDAVAGAQPTEPPDQPSGLSATASHDSVTLTWDDPGDDSITGYVILRRIPGVDPEGQFDELVADTGTAATTYTDDTVAAGTTYTYRIKAINGAGTSDRSHWSHIDTPAAPVPDKPTGLSATASHDAITLTWEDPGDDSITGYVILRRLRYDDPSGHFDELVADTGTAATTYTDDTVKANTSYTYRIKAINEHGGVSERSRWFHIDTPAAP